LCMSHESTTYANNNELLGYRIIAMPTLTEAERFFTKLLGALRSGVWIIKGTEGLSGEPIRLLFALSEKQKAHVYRGSSAQRLQ
jgi:hypothetical protein